MVPSYLKNSQGFARTLESLLSSLCTLNTFTWLYSSLILHTFFILVQYSVFKLTVPYSAAQDRTKAYERLDGGLLKLAIHFSGSLFIMHFRAQTEAVCCSFI